MKYIELLNTKNSPSLEGFFYIIIEIYVIIWYNIIMEAKYGLYFI